MIITTKAIILRATRYREADQILLLFTEQAGIVSAIAASSRKSHKRFGGALTSYALFEATLHPPRRGTGQSPLYRLTEARLVVNHSALSEDLCAMGGATWLLELLRARITREDPNPPLFHMVSDALKLLATPTQVQPRVVTAVTALRILAASGVGLVTDRCCSCGTPVPANRPVYIHPPRGGVVCSQCGGGPLLLNAAQAAHLCHLQRVTIEKSASLRCSVADCEQVERVLVAFASYHLESDLCTTAFGLMQHTPFAASSSDATGR